jgi:hypothetical protein
MSRAIAVVLALGLGACGALPVEGDGIVLLQVVQPASLTLREGTSVQLTARALDKSGAEVVAEIVWRTPDTGVLVDETTGLVTGQAESGTARVQASVGSLRSDFLTFTLRPAE